MDGNRILVHRVFGIGNYINYTFIDENELLHCRSMEINLILAEPTQNRIFVEQTMCSDNPIRQTDSKP